MKLPGIDNGENDLRDVLPNFGFTIPLTEDERFDIKQTGFNIVRNRLDKSIQRLLFSNDTIEDSDLRFIWKGFYSDKKYMIEKMRGMR